MSLLSGSVSNTRRSLNLEIVKNVHASMMHYADISYMLILLVCVWFDLCGLYHGTTVRAPVSVTGDEIHDLRIETCNLFKL